MSMRTADPILTGGRDRRSRPASAGRSSDAAPAAPQVVILAAGMGTRLGRKQPKPLTPLMDGRSIMQQQLDGVRAVFGDAARVTAVVGYRAKAIMRAQPELLFAFNPDFASTNTSQSLLRALRSSPAGGVLWLNGDVVFDPAVLDHAAPLVLADESFVCVDTSTVADEEVKYTLDADGFVAELSKTVVGGLGEAVGINYVSAADKPALIEHLGSCQANDYFERGMELSIQHSGVRFRPLDISRFSAVEVDFDDDLQRANTWLSSRATLEPLASELG
jgi:CDP-glycerol glycerophosphotransferase